MRLLAGEARGGRPLGHGPLVAVADPLSDDDLHLALYCLYELHYRGFREVSDDLEWDPAVLRYRRTLEQAFEGAIRDAVVEPAPRAADLRQRVVDAIDRADGRSLSGYMESIGTIEQLREFAMHRSAYQLKEADPHTWAIPRLSGEAKAALIHIQTDEYGYGRNDDMHSTLFATTMRELALDDTYGAYLPSLPGSTLATVNLVSMLGLHRRLRGALIGHLAVFEMTSVVPMGRYASALSRFGLGEAARRFYDVHVIADADHEVVALQRMVHELGRQEPELADDIVFGAQAVLEIERRFAEHLLDSWAMGGSSLREVRTLAA